MKQIVQRSPKVRAVFFFVGATLTLVTGMYTLRDKKYNRTALPFLVTLPLLLALRRYIAYATAEPIDVDWTRARRQFLQGSALGAASVLLDNLVAWRLGWVTYPHWGWKVAPPREVAYYVLVAVTGDFAVAVCEEMVYRGYGFATVSQAIGQPAALLLLVPMFGFHHSFANLDQIVTYAMAGSTLTVLRLASGDVWLPAGFHWAFNITETALFGNPVWHPSIRPRTFTGTPFWMGTDERLGMLLILIQAAIAAAVLAHSRTRRAS